jgi:hypothetical protein
VFRSDYHEEGTAIRSAKKIDFFLNNFISFTNFAASTQKKKHVCSEFSMTLESASQQKIRKNVINKTGPFVDKQIIILTNAGLKKLVLMFIT